MNYITDCSELKRFIDKTDIFWIDSVTVINEPAPQDIVRKCITRALFSPDIDEYNEEKEERIIEAVVNNLYVKINAPVDDYKSSIYIQPIQGYSINLERETECPLFKAMRRYFCDDVAVTVRQVNSYKNNEISYYGTFCGVDRDDFTFFDSSAPLIMLSEVNSTVAIVKYHNKPSSIGGLFKYSHASRFNSQDCTYEDLMHALSEVKKLSDPSVDEVLIKLHKWYGGIVILGDFSQTLDFQFTGTSNGDYVIIGELPHSVYDLHAWLLMDTRYNNYYLSDLEAYKALSQSMIHLGSNHIHYIE